MSGGEPPQGPPLRKGPPRGDADEGPCAVVLRACEKGFCADDIGARLVSVWEVGRWERDRKLKVREVAGEKEVVDSLPLAVGEDELSLRDA